MDVKNISYLIFGTIIISSFIIHKFNPEKLAIYKNIQRNIIVYVFMYLLGVCLLTNVEGKLNGINPMHILVSFLIILILPLILLKLSNKNLFKTIIIKKNKIIKISDIIFCIILIFISIFILFNKNSYVDQYILNLLIYINSILLLFRVGLMQDN